MKKRFETSACLGVGVDEAAKCLISKIVKTAPKPQENNGKIKLKPQQRQNDDDGGCPC